VRSRVKQTGGANAEAASHQQVTAQGQAGTSQAPVPGTDKGPADGSRHAGSAGPARRRRASRPALRNWRVRSRLLLLIIIPTLTAVILGGISITASIQSARANQRVQTLATLGQQITVLAQALEDERDQTAVYIALGPDGGRLDGVSATAALRSKAAPELTVVARESGSTDVAAAQVRALAGQIGSSYSPQAQQGAATVLTALRGLRYLRSAAITTQLPVLVVVQKYSQLIDDVLALNDQIAQTSNDPTLAQTVRSLGLVSAMQEEASQQRAILSAGLLEGQFAPGQMDAIDAAQSAQQSNLAAFDLSASVGEQVLWNESVNRSFVYQASSEELQAISLQTSAGWLENEPTPPMEWAGVVR
jgi:hypothetical protein